MKITFLSTLYPFRGGIAQFNASLYRALEKQHQLYAVTFKRQYPQILFPGETQYVTEHDPADPIDSRRWLDSINPLNWIKTGLRVKALHSDLLVMKFWMPFFGPSLGYVAAHAGKNTKTIAILDNVIPHEKRFFDMAFIRYFLKRVDGFVVMSEQVKSDLLSIKPNARFVSLPHPLYNHFGAPLQTTEARQKLHIDPHKKTLLFFGFIRDYKGLDLLIDAFDQLPDDYQLIIAGESYGSFEKYNQQIDQCRNAKNIHKFVRYIADSEVPLFFSAADACVLPYKSATQSGITSIAYHFNLPMIATDVGGLKEMVIDNQTGVIVEKPTIEQIHDGIVRYFEADRQQFLAHIEAKKQTLSWEVFAQKIIEFHKELL